MFRRRETFFGSFFSLKICFAILDTVDIWRRPLVIRSRMTLLPPDETLLSALRADARVIARLKA